MGNKDASVLISQSEAARILGVSRQYVNKLVKAEKISHTVIAGIPFLYFDEIEALKDTDHEQA